MSDKLIVPLSVSLSPSIAVFLWRDAGGIGRVAGHAMRGDDGTHAFVNLVRVRVRRALNAVATRS